MLGWILYRLVADLYVVLSLVVLVYWTSCVVVEYAREHEGHVPGPCELDTFGACRQTGKFLRTLEAEFTNQNKPRGVLHAKTMTESWVEDPDPDEENEETNKIAAVQ